MPWSCVICMELLDNSKKIVSSLCGHVYHLDCIRKWTKNSRTCPECRQNISSKVKLTPHTPNHVIKQEVDLRHTQCELISKNFALYESAQEKLKLERENIRNCALMKKDLSNLIEELNVMESELKSNQSKINNLIAMTIADSNRLKELEEDINLYKGTENVFNSTLKNYKSQTAINREKQAELETGCLRKRTLGFKILKAKSGQLENIILHGKFQDPETNKSFIQSLNEMEELLKQYPNLPYAKVSLKKLDPSILKQARGKKQHSLHPNAAGYLKKYPNLLNAKVSLKRLDSSFLKYYYFDYRRRERCGAKSCFP